MGDYGLNKVIYLYKDSFSLMKLRSGKAHHQLLPCTSLLEGFRRMGWNPHVVQFSHAKPQRNHPDIGVMFNFWSKNKEGLSKQKISEHHTKHNIPLICMDAGAFTSYMSINKGGSHKRVGWKFHRFGLDSPLGTGRYFNHNSDSKQFDLYKDLVPDLSFGDWKKGSHVLVLAQNPIGFQFQDENNTYVEWINKTIDEIRKVTDRKIIVRMHPNSKPSNSVLHGGKGNRKLVTIARRDNVEISQLQGRLNFFEGLKDAHCCVTHSSSAAVDSIMFGVPTFVLSDRCIVHAGLEQVWEDDLSKIESITERDRTQWAYNMAYTSYTNEQLDEGKPAEKFLEGLNML